METKSSHKFIKYSKTYFNMKWTSSMGATTFLKLYHVVFDGGLAGHLLEIRIKPLMVYQGDLKDS
jgi:hypothetical protein